MEIVLGVIGALWMLGAGFALGLAAAEDPDDVGFGDVVRIVAFYPFLYGYVVWKRIR